MSAGSTLAQQRCLGQRRVDHRTTIPLPRAQLAQRIREIGDRVHGGGSRRIAQRPCGPTTDDMFMIRPDRCCFMIGKTSQPRAVPR